MEINAYGTSGTSNLNISTKKGSELDMNDFLNLMVSQITNQDSMNPMENTEFVSQMAQFSALQAMTDLSEISMQGQATSLIGKNVVMASYNSRGELEIEEGIVQKVTIHSGETKIYVNDIEYDYSNVMEVKNKSEEAVTEMDIVTQMLEGINSIKNFLIKDDTLEGSAIEGSQIN